MEGILKRWLDFGSDQDRRDAIRNNLTAGATLKGTTLAILFCAIIIASVGLNTNSVAVIIGAMLISPLMNPILAMGYSAATYNTGLFKSGLQVFLAQVAIALVGAILYFSLSPIKVATPEIMARTSPSFFDMVIAFVGGFAGIIGATRKEKSNVIPGVAIATALMPPLCTVGYGISTRQWHVALGSGYLFLINVFFILLSTYIFCQMIQLSPKYLPKSQRIDMTHYDHVAKRIFLLASLMIMIPALISSFFVSQGSLDTSSRDNNIDVYVRDVVNSHGRAFVDSTVDEDNKTLTISFLGEDVTAQERQTLETSMAEHGLKEYRLILKNDINQVMFDYFKNKE